MRMKTKYLGDIVIVTAVLNLLMLSTGPGMERDERRDKLEKWKTVRSVS